MNTKVTSITALGVLAGAALVASAGEPALLPSVRPEPMLLPAVESRNVARVWYGIDPASPAGAFEIARLPSPEIEPPTPGEMPGSEVTITRAENPLRAVRPEPDALWPMADRKSEYVVQRPADYPPDEVEAPVVLVGPVAAPESPRATSPEPTIMPSIDDAAIGSGIESPASPVSSIRLPPIEPVPPLPAYTASDDAEAPLIPEFDTSTITQDAPHDAVGSCGAPNAVWYAQADVIVLGRSKPNGDTSLTNCYCVVPTHFRPYNAGLDTGVGDRYTLGRYSQCGVGWEAQYYQIDTWDNERWFGGNIGVLSNNLGVGVARWRYASDLTNLEINRRWDVSPWMTLLAGARWIQLDEQASLDAAGTLIPSFNRQIGVDNTLLGGQLGIDYRLYDHGGLFRVNVVTKGGVFNNHQRLTPTGFPPPTAESNDEIAFAGDLQVIGTYQLTRHLSLAGGYYLLGLSNVALAPNQFGDPTVIDQDHLILQGGTLGVNFCW